MRVHCLYCMLTLALAPMQAVEIATPFTDNAVLQRGKPLPIWGNGTAGERVTVRFADQEKTATVADDGRWRVTLEALQACKEGRSLEVVGAVSGTAKVGNILVGEVWLCSGQSNMEFKLNAVVNAKTEIAEASLPLIRLLDIPNDHAREPRSAVRGSWRVCAPNTAGAFTAVGFFFAREISTGVDVPVGLVEADWGGTRIEPWIPPVGFHSVPELTSLIKLVDSWDVATPTGNEAWRAYVGHVKDWLPSAEKAIEEKNAMPELPQAPQSKDDHQEPTRLCNAMVHPLAPMALRGVLWYQGESNGGEGDSYVLKQRALVQGWRKLFGDEDLAFYWVQLANYQAPSDPEKPWLGDGWARTREAQFKSLAIPHTGMATIIDIGEANDIHPKDKQDVGHRLAVWALAQDYGKNVVRSGPLFRGFVVEGAAIRVAFDHVGGGLIVGEKHGLEPVTEVKDGRLAWFAIAGEDKAWRKADARIDGETVVVSASGVSKPVAVRYAFAMNPQGCNLYNREGLPASPFRTDAW